MSSLTQPPKVKILIIQFREDITKNHEQQCINKFLETNYQFDYLDIFDPTSAIKLSNPNQLLSSYDGVILGGSGAISMGYGHTNNDYNKANYIIRTIRNLLEYITTDDFPALGICFGHQLLGDYLGSKVSFDKHQSESGFATINITKIGQADKIFSQIQVELKEKLWCVTMHQDSLMTLPTNTVLLATTDKCNIASFRYKTNIYGVQFHPELTKKDLLYRFSLFPQYKIEDTTTQDSTKITQIIKLFLKTLS